MVYTESVVAIIKKRFSCRSYVEEALQPHERDLLAELLSQSTTGPLGTRTRFALAAATGEDWSTLKGLGTYGFIRGAAGFIIGAVGPGGKNMEDYGYLMERAVLFATDMGLGTCWLGGTFSKSGFSRKISPEPDELIPAVVAVGHMANRRRWFDSFIRRRAGSDNRLPWAAVFFDEDFQTPLSQEEAGAYATPLEMVRLGPSASNKQPWRIIKKGRVWHFYVQRSKGYGYRNMALMRLADLQRLDLGIAMCHFELSALEAGMSGVWSVLEPGIEKPDNLTEYVVSWNAQI